MLFQFGKFTLFNCGFVTTQDISINWVPQIGEFASGVRETSKLVGTELILLFQFGKFTLFNCALVTTQDISINCVPQVRESTSGVRETSKLGGT
jgi:hypothetical protein